MQIDLNNSRGFYRSRRGIIGGVCRGLAERFDISVFWTRAAAAVAFLFTGFWPAGVLYLAAWLLLKPAPMLEFENSADHEFYDSYTTSRRRAIERLQQMSARLEKRLQNMESHVTDKGFDWDERLQR